MRRQRSKRKKGRRGFNGFIGWCKRLPVYVQLHPRRYIIIGVVLVLIIAGVVACFALIKPPSSQLQEESQSGEEDPLSEEELVGEVIDIADEANRKEGWYTFLVAGCDQSGANTDTILVGAYDRENKEVNIVSIPRDTLVNTTWAVKKINAAYLHNGIDGLKKELKKIMGFVPDSYAIVDLEAFIELVDTIGGVDYNVPVEMKYRDPTQDLVINLEPGYQHLDGYQAMGVMRFRSGYPDADIGRISTQQDFLKTFAKQCLQMGNVTKVKDFADIFAEYVETDMSLGNIVWYGSEFLKLSEEDINFHSLPSNNGASIRGGSYVSIYVSDWVDMINEILNPYDTDIRAGNLNILTTQGGSLYSTSGVVAGGENSFLNYYVLTGKPDPNAPAQEPEGAESEYAVDPATGYVIDPATGFLIDPSTGQFVQSGGGADSSAGSGTEGGGTGSGTEGGGATTEPGGTEGSGATTEPGGVEGGGAITEPGGVEGGGAATIDPVVTPTDPGTTTGPTVPVVDSGTGTGEEPGSAPGAGAADPGSSLPDPAGAAESGRRTAGGNNLGGEQLPSPPDPNANGTT